MIQSVWKNLTGLQKAAEHLWCDFKCRPKINHYQWLVHSLYGQKYWDTPSLEEKKALPNCGNKDGNIIHVLKNCISTSVATFLKCMKWLYPYVIGVCLVMNFWSAFKVTPEVFSCFLQTSQVLPHWLNHHFSLILALNTETQSILWNVQLMKKQVLKSHSPQM